MGHFWVFHTVQERLSVLVFVESVELWRYTAPLTIQMEEEKTHIPVCIAVSALNMSPEITLILSCCIIYKLAPTDLSDTGHISYD